MESKQKLKPGAFKESRDRFTRARKQKPAKEDVLSILEKAKKPTDDRSNKKIARDGDVEV